MQALTRCTFFAALALCGAACQGPDLPSAVRFSGGTVADGLPTVTAATVAAGRVSVQFTQAMKADATVSATTLYKLNAHAYGDLSVAGTPIPISAQWPDDRTLTLRFDPVPGTYVLEIREQAKSLLDRALDGLSGAGEPAGIHRVDDDGVRGPSAYQTLPVRVGRNVPVYAALPSRPGGVVTAVTAWHAEEGIVRDDNPELMYTFGAPRVTAFPPYQDDVSLRISFGGPQALPFRVFTGGAVADELQLFSESGDRIGTEVDLSHLPAQQWGVREDLEVVGSSGRTVTVSTGPGFALNTHRNPDETVWLLLGSAPPPTGLLAEVTAWDSNNLRYTVAESPQPISGTVWGTTVVTEQLWFAGELDGGYTLALTSGAERRILTATGETIYLAAATSSTDCAGCTVRLTHIEERAGAGTPIALASDQWFLHPSRTWPASRILYLSVNGGGRVASVAGVGLDDRERDGDEQAQPPEPDDEFILQLALRPSREIQPPVSRINNGAIYETVFADQGFACLGDPGKPICVEVSTQPRCDGTPAHKTAYVSFYTSDGDTATPLGVDDLLQTGRLSDEDVTLLDGASGRPLVGTLSSQVVLNQTPDGTYPTTLLRYDLATQEGCTDGSRRLRGFRAGDRLVISHQIRATVPKDPKTIDGNGDGVASASPVDDWIGVYDVATGTFEPLVRTPGGP